VSEPFRARPKGMDHASWSAFRKAWNHATEYPGRTTALRRQLCQEYGISLQRAYRLGKLGAGLGRAHYGGGG